MGNASRYTATQHNCVNLVLGHGTQAISVVPSTNRLQKRRGHVTPIVHCIHSKIQKKNITVTHLVTTTALVVDSVTVTILSIDLNFARYNVTCPLSFLESTSPWWYVYTRYILNLICHPLPTNSQNEPTNCTSHITLLLPTLDHHQP